MLATVKVLLLTTLLAGGSPLIVAEFDNPAACANALYWLDGERDFAAASGRVEHLTTLPAGDLECRPITKENNQ